MNTLTYWAGDNFTTRVLDAIEEGRDTVMIQIAGEYGHLRVEALRDFQEA
jgi:hypothetical protein